MLIGPISEHNTQGHDTVTHIVLCWCFGELGIYKTYLAIVFTPILFDRYCNKFSSFVIVMSMEIGNNTRY